MDYSQIGFLDDLSQFTITFNETSGAYGSGQNRVFDHAPPVHNRTEPYRTIIDHYAGGIDLHHPSHPSFHTPRVPHVPVGDFGALTDFPQHNLQMSMGCFPPPASPVNPNAGNLSPPAFFTVDPRHVGRQRPSAVYPPLDFNQPCSLHQTRKAEPNLSNVPSPKSPAEFWPEMTSARTQSFSRSPCPSSAQAKSPSTLHRRGGKRRSRRPSRQTGAKIAPQATYNYQCLWGPCEQLIHGDKNNIRKHLKDYHAVPVDEMLVTCLWEGTCGDEMRGDSIPRHIEMHLGMQWVCLNCDTLLSRKDSVYRHLARYDGSDCTGVDIHELPGPGVLRSSPDATSVC